MDGCREGGREEGKSKNILFIYNGQLCFLLKCLKSTKIVMMKYHKSESKYFCRASKDDVVLESKYSIVSLIKSNKNRWSLTHAGNQIVNGLSKGKSLAHSIMKSQVSILHPQPTPVLSRLNLTSQSLVTP